VLVPLYLGREPAGVRYRAGEDDQRRGWNGLIATAGGVGPGEALQSAVPSAAVAWVEVRTSMLGVAAIWSIRYCDIRAASELPRTTRVTWRAHRAELTAACPAELALPAIKACSPAKALLRVVAR